MYNDWWLNFKTWIDNSRFIEVVPSQVPALLTLIYQGTKWKNFIIKNVIIIVEVEWIYFNT